MTVNEFWQIIDNIDVDSRDDGAYTEQEMYDIGCIFIEMNNSQKREIGGWDKLVEILKPLDKNGDPMKKGDTFRQWIKGRRYRQQDMIHNDHMISGQNIQDITFSDFKEKTEEIKQNLYKQQIKTRDTMNSYRRTLRDEARIENIKEIISDSIKELKDLPEVTFDKFQELTSNEAVLMLSDLHIGVNIDNYFNKYNSQVASERLSKLVTDTIEYCQRNSVEKLNILNLGDMIQGIIHVSGRIEEETDVISQVMIASEYLAQAINKLQEAAPYVIYRSCTDNHARVVADMKQHIEKENFGRLIDFYLKARLANTGVVFAEDNLDDDIGMFDLNNGKKLLFVHGHRDSYNTIVQSFLGATHQFIDFICLGHYHESKMKGFEGAKVFVNGSIVGSEQYAQSKRLYGYPEQTLLIFENNNVIPIYINLNELNK